MKSNPENTCHLYILKSLDKDWYYIGVTNNLDDRLERHNQGRSKSTKPYKPFQLVFTKEFSSKSEAMKVEKKLKDAKNRKAIFDYINSNS